MHTIYKTCITLVRRLNCQGANILTNNKDSKYQFFSSKIIFSRNQKKLAQHWHYFAIEQ